MHERKYGKPNYRCKVFWLVLASLLAGCGQRRGIDHVILSYSESPRICEGCPRFRVELRTGGHVTLFGLSSCAIPGEYNFVVLETGFSSLLAAFEKARFFSIPRVDTRYFPTDSTVKRLAYRDEFKFHEVMDVERPLPAISQLEEDFRHTTQIERYLKPSLALYQELVKSGWDVNTLGEDHENALPAAILAGDSASVAFLIRHGAMVSRRAFEWAVRSKTIEMLRLLADAKRIDYHSAEGGALLLLALGGSAEAVQYLLDRGAPVNYRQPQSEDTPLLVVARYPGQINTARMLIERGADVNARDSMGETALFRAATLTNTGMIELLAAHGADPNIRDKQGRTAIVGASNLCWYWNIKALLAHGADPLIRDNRGRTALEPDYVDHHDQKCSIAMQLLKEAASRSR